MGGTAIVIDIASIGRGVDYYGIDSRLLQCLRAQFGSRPIGAINRYPQTGEISYCPYQVFNIKFLGAFAFFFNLANCFTEGAVGFIPQKLLDLILNRVGELIATAGKELDPVIGHGIVGGGNHYPQVNVSFRGEIGDAGGGDNPDAVDVHALGG